MLVCWLWSFCSIGSGRFGESSSNFVREAPHTAAQEAVCAGPLACVQIVQRAGKRPRKTNVQSFCPGACMHCTVCMQAPPSKKNKHKTNIHFCFSISLRRGVLAWNAKHSQHELCMHNIPQGRQSCCGERR